MAAALLVSASCASVLLLLVVVLQALRVGPSTRTCARQRTVMFFGWVFFLISPTYLHVLRAHMGRACRWPGEIELTPIGVELNGPSTRTRLACPRFASGSKLTSSSGRSGARSSSACKVANRLVPA